MKGGTKTLLFGVHQFLFHPYAVLRGWLTLYRQWPRPYQMLAILIHDLGLWGMPDVDGDLAETHPQVVHDACMRIAKWKGRGRKWEGFWTLTALEVVGHSRFYAKRAGIDVTQLYYADKLATNFYPMWLYHLLGRLSGEIDEYMERYSSGKYSSETKIGGKHTRKTWFLEARAAMTKLGLSTLED